MNAAQLFSLFKSNRKIEFFFLLGAVMLLILLLMAVGGISLVVKCTVGVSVLASFFIVSVAKYHRFIPYLPLIILWSPYLPMGIRFDWLIVLHLFLVVLLFHVRSKRSVLIEPVSLNLLILTILALGSTVGYALLKSDFSTVTASSFTMLQYWVRVGVICSICFWCARFYSPAQARIVIKLFYFSVLLMAIIGILESARVLPSGYDDFIGKFMPSSVDYMRASLLALDYRRATSFMEHPTTFAYLMLFSLILTVYCKEKILAFVGRWMAILIFLIAAASTMSKIVFVMVPIIYFYFSVVVAKRFGIFFLSVFVALSALFLVYSLGANEAWSGTVVRQFYFFINAIQNLGIYELFFRTRFDSETGLLSSSFDVLFQSPVFGIGVNFVPGVFYGDSAYLSVLLRYGLLGGVFFVIVFYQIYQRAKLASREAEDWLIHCFLETCRLALLLSLVVGIGAESFSLFKVSEIIYFFIFYTYYGQRERMRD